MSESEKSSASILHSKRLILGVTGGVAAYKAAHLARELGRAGADVHVVMTEAATQFVGPATFSALTGNPVWTNAWDPRAPNTMAHIELTRGAAAILVAPATADFMAKLAHGHADDLLSTLCAARNRTTTRLAVAPAMNREMWDNPANLRNVAQLAADGIDMFGPGSGDQACGEVGAGRMWEPEMQVAALEAALTPKALLGQRAIVTAGPTHEAIDPVRVITNLSSGNMGFALAQALANAGASVTLVAGPSALATPFGVERIDVTSAESMHNAVMARISDCQLFCGVAAVADYTPLSTHAEKLKKSDAALTLALTPTIDILKTVAAVAAPPFCVGFAAESHNVVQYAREKRLRKKLPLIVANRAQDAMGAADNAVTLIDDTGEHDLPRAPKPVIARQIVAHMVRLMQLN